MWLTLSAQLADTDDVPVTARRQSQLLDTLHNVVDAMQTAAAESRLLTVSGDVTGIREVERIWEPVVCREGEVRNDDDLNACCKITHGSTLTDIDDASGGSRGGGDGGDHGDASPILAILRPRPQC